MDLNAAGETPGARIPSQPWSNTLAALTMRVLFLQHPDWQRPDEFILGRVTRR